MPSSPQTTELLLEVARGDRSAANTLLPLVYDELRALAEHYMRRERPGHTLQATALVHEAYLRLIDQSRVDWKSRAHFFGAAANAMRNILVEQARKKATLKRDGTRKQELQTDLPEILPGAPVDDVLSLHDALGKLEEAHERPARIVELRFFAGLSMPEAAEIVGVSLATAERDWRFARSWLQHEMEEGSGR